MANLCEFGKCFNLNTLRYGSPAHGGWGIVRMGHLVPQCYELFVCPFACGRHGALSSILQGRKDRVSYLYIDEADIISGSYEDLIFEACEELLEVLRERKKYPKVLMVVTSCIDDLMGTDCDKLEEELEKRFLDVKFIFGHMNPITLDKKTPPGITMQNKIYSLLNKTDLSDEGVNIIGNLTPLVTENELFGVLKSLRFDTIRHISNFKTFDGFQNMAKSKLNVLISPKAKMACELMEKNLKIPYIELYNSYNPENILQNYEKFSDYMGNRLKFDFEIEINNLDKTIRELKNILKDFPIVLDEEAVLFPYEFSDFLLQNGFNVKKIFATSPKLTDIDYFNNIKKRYKDVELIIPYNPKQRFAPEKLEECVSIGLESGYLTSSFHNVGLCGEDGLYGFFGLNYILEKILDSYKNKTDLKENIERAGLVV